MIIGTLFWILLFLTILSILWIIWAFNDGSEDAKIYSVICPLLGLGVLGWLLCGGIIPQEIKTQNVLLDIMFNETTVIALNKENKVVFQSSNVSEWNILHDKKVFSFIKTTKLNMYGVECQPVTYQLKLND
jgi:type IV secretory pathway TrbL component